ncbi:unnamed protein product, partial [Ilex paraguariensis]
SSGRLFQGFDGLSATKNPRKKGLTLDFSNIHSKIDDESYLTDGTLDLPIDWIPSMRGIRFMDLPSFLRTTNPNDIMFDFMGEEAQNCLNASTIIFNSFDALEHEVLEAFTSKFNYPNTYTIGPLHLLCRNVPESEVKSLNSSLWKPDSHCLQWLDQRERDSVVYVNYGSVATMSVQHFQEFAWGLANSKQPFLWIVRPDILQESICEGVPMICWPFFADQQTNCRYSCTEWGIGMEINHDVNREEVEELVRQMMEGEKGQKMRVKARDWKKKAEEATTIGGSSYNNFDKFIEKALHYKEK